MATLWIETENKLYQNQNRKKKPSKKHIAYAICQRGAHIHQFIHEGNAHILLFSCLFGYSIVFCDAVVQRHIDACQKWQVAKESGRGETERKRANKKEINFVLFHVCWIGKTYLKKKGNIFIVHLSWNQRLQAKTRLERAKTVRQKFIYGSLYTCICFGIYMCVCVSGPPNIHARRRQKKPRKVNQSIKKKQAVHKGMK